MIVKTVFHSYGGSLIDSNERGACFTDCCGSLSESVTKILLPHTAVM